MNCEDWTLRINALLDGALSPAETVELTGHLKTCPDCRQMLDDLASLRGALAALDRDERPSEALLARVHGVVDPPAPRLRPLRWSGSGRRRVLGLVASAALAAGVLLALWPGKDVRPDLMSVRDAALRGGVPQGDQGKAPAVPGFTLVAAHRDLVAGHRAEVALYRRGNATVTLCLWAAGREPAHGTLRAVYHGMTIAYWNDGRTEFWAASAAGAPALADFVQGLRGSGEG